MEDTSPADARQKLVAAAIDLFGKKGRDGVSTREIASAAGVNISGIAYHFGGKDKLHTACAEHIAKTLQTGIATRLAPVDPLAPAAMQLESTLVAIAQFMLATPGNAAFARFVLREQMDPSAAFEVLYAQFMEPLHRRLCQLWSGATGGDAEAQTTRLRVFGLLSQVLFFRMAEAGALRRMGWSTLGSDEISLIVASLKHCLEALLSSEGRAP